MYLDIYISVHIICDQLCSVYIYNIQYKMYHILYIYTLNGIRPAKNLKLVEDPQPELLQLRSPETCGDPEA